MKNFIVGFLVLFVMTSCQVYAGPTTYWITSGEHTCGHYIKVLEGHRQNNYSDTDEYYLYMSWFEGFATCQSHIIKEDVLHGSDLDAITLWLEKYCKDHPMDSFTTASENFLNAIKNK